MIEFFKDVYAFLVTGAGVTLLVGALLYWYAVHIDSKQYDDFFPCAQRRLACGSP